jgi:hypothetical protein
MPIAVLCLITTARAAIPESANDLGELESKIITSRRAIGSGEFKVQVRSKESSDLDYHIWISKDGQVRQERQVNGQLQVSIFNSEFAYYYSGTPELFANPILTHRKAIHQIPIREARADRSPFLICNPLVLMFVPTEFSLLPHFGLEKLINSRERRDITLKPTRWKGLDAVCVMFVRSETGDSYEYDVVPSRNYNIVRWRLRGMIAVAKGNPIPMEYNQLCDLQEISQNVWFPKHIELKGVWSGNPKTNETVEVVASRIGEEFPAQVFSLGWKGALPPKQVVVQHLPSTRSGPMTRPISPEVLLWDGERVRGYRHQDDVERRQSAHAGEVFLQPHYARVTAVVLAVCGALAIGIWVLRLVMAWHRKVGR